MLKSVQEYLGGTLRFGATQPGDSCFFTNHTNLVNSLSFSISSLKNKYSNITPYFIGLLQLIKDIMYVNF